uniref:Uncharacterized protein n=1 Tax=Rhizophora mucronata TaxID=61149 RepID=A0A2P2IQ44_RHIMU
MLRKLAGTSTCVDIEQSKCMAQHIHDMPFPELATNTTIRDSVIKPLFISR